MGQELPDNLVYAYIDPGTVRSSQQSRRAEGGISYTGRTPYVNMQKADPQKSQMRNY